MAVRVLLLEDNPHDAELVERELKRADPEVEVRRVATGEEYERALGEQAPDLILTDHRVPGYGGRQALERAREAAPGVPFILVTGSLSDETAVEYMKAGAADYVLKDRLGRLGAAARGALEQVRQEAEQRRLREQLMQAQKMESIGRLAGGVAHDFNNLLTVVLGNVELLLADTPPDDLRRCSLEEIRLAGQKAADLTRQLLALGRRQVLQPRILDLNELVAGLEPMLRRVLGEDLDLVSHLAPDLGRVRADPSQLEQVIMNLVVNARDAMPEGGRLTLETANAELDEGYAAGHRPVEPGSYVLLAVSDTGVGMNEETKAHLFEPFFTTKEPGKGTGLGLATVYGIVQQSGGYVWVYSEPGRGTVFKTFLPRVAEEREAAEARPPAPGLRGGAETILVVEDDGAVRGLVRRGLAAFGYAVLEAASVEEALAVVAAAAPPIHLLLTDVVVAGGSGPELARRLAEGRPDLPVLYMSGYANGAVLHHRVLAAGTAFLPKPFTVAELVRKVREVLDAGPAGRIPERH